MITKRIKRIWLCIGSLCMITIASGNVIYAAPSSKDLEVKTSDLQGEINSLNKEVAALGEELDETSSKIIDLAAKTEKTKIDLAAAKLNEDAQYDSMKDRIQFMYEGGDLSLLTILCSSDNMADFLNKAEYVTTISEYDRNMLDELCVIRAEIEKKQDDLQEQQEELTLLKDELTEKQEELNLKINSASGQLSAYRAELERAKNAEAALATAQDNSVSGAVSTADTETDTAAVAVNNNVSDQGASVDSGVSISAGTSDVALLAAVIQCEAGSGNPDGMLAVATVIMNRVSSPLFPNSISEVIYQPGQFYPAGSAVLGNVLAQGPSASACSVAQSAIGGARHPSVANCFYFYAAWYAAQVGQSGTNIGGNVFF